MKKLYSLFLILSLGTLVFGQLTPFTLTVTATPESCMGNGALEFETADTTEGASITYSIYKLPNEDSAIATTSNDMVEGLNAGEYKVVATQSNGNVSNTATNTATIEDNKVPLEYSFTTVIAETCGADGLIDVNVTSGTEPYEYQIIDDNNNVIVSQTSPKFTGLTAGNYKIRVIDACGLGVVKTVKIDGLNLAPKSTKVSLYQPGYRCDRRIRFEEVYEAGNLITNMDLTYEVSFTNPTTGATVTITEDNTTQLGPNDKEIFFVDIPDFPGETITYHWKITDQCGTVRSGSFEAFNNYRDREIIDISNLINNADCGKSYGIRITSEGVIKPVSSTITDITLTEVPAGVDMNSVYTRAYTGSSGSKVFTHIGNISNPLEAGIYKGVLTVCGGQQIPFEYDYQPSIDAIESNFLYQGVFNKSTACDLSSEMHRFYNKAGIDNIKILNPPSTGTIGIRAGNNIYAYLYLYDYPAGDYQIELSNECGAKEMKTITVTAPLEIVHGQIETEFLCGGFNLLQQAAPKNAPTTYYRYLQIYDEDLGAWTTPETDVDAQAYEDSDGTINLYSKSKLALKLHNSTKDATGLSSRSDIEFNGKFRVLEQYRNSIYDEDGKRTYAYCVEVISEFENYNTPILSNMYSYVCNDGSYNIGVVPAAGVGPFTYQIVESPNSTATENIIIDNGSDQLFTDLAPGKYNFRIINGCGNINTIEYDITTLGSPQIITTANCETQEVLFSLSGVDYLNFEWYKEDAPDTILSTESSLNLGTLEASEIGTYKVRITSGQTSSCINDILQVSITDNPFTAPNAGEDFTVGPMTPQKLDLIQLLIDNNPNIKVDSYGDFEFIFADGQTVENSGPLSGATWYANLAKEGVYQFKYTVKGLCGEVDEAIMTIINKHVCVKAPSTAPSEGVPPIGISNLNRKKTDNNWLNEYNNGWVALESRTKGFVITRADDANHPENIAEPVEGMLVFDIDENCLKLYDGTQWGCIARGCDE